MTTARGKARAGNLTGWLAAGWLACGTVLGCSGGSDEGPSLRPEPAAAPTPEPDLAAAEPAETPMAEGAEASGAAAAEGSSEAAPDPSALAPDEPTQPVVLDPEAQAALFHDVIRTVVRMPRDRALQRAARERHMRLMNVMWEDTGRSYGSSGGPNISDLTLEVIERRGERRARTYLMPVLRYPNFTDRTADLPSERFIVRVGNERADGELTTIALPELLAHVREHLSLPDDYTASSEDDLTAPRDTHYLVSAQHVFVPVPQGMHVEFAPVLFNYQSQPGDPAVLCIVATREGTSIQVIENRSDRTLPVDWGQRLYFNHGGQRTVLTAERRSDVAARVEADRARAEDVGALDDGADMVAIIQVPLRQAPQRRRMASGGAGSMNDMAGSGGGAESRARRSDVEVAVIGHGLDDGPFVETRRRRIRRDRRFPIRVTIQFYRATSNGIVSEEDLEAAVAQIERVYSDADFVGSLVVGSLARPTAHRVGQ